MRPGGRGQAQSRLRARHARPRTKAMNAAAVEAAGTGRSPMSRILNTKTTLKKLIKKINKENTPPGGWKKSDKPQATSSTQL